MSMELLSPAGSMASLKAAVQSGADAVYLGAAEFSARAGAENFSEEELARAVRYCHIYGVKVHCALNTLIKENEFIRAAEAAKMIYRAGADAIIIQDMGLAAYLRRIMPEMELHGSTQMTVTSLEGAEFLKDMGLSRAVLARELTLREIEAIAKGTDIETEVFVHGAICMCYSGQCLMSSILGGRSGNRGRCAQPCRLFYSIERDGKKCGEGYILSPKDMALADHLGEIGRAGVTSLKIEGRLKSPEYVSAVTGVYRKCLDSGGKTGKADREELRAAFSRSGFTDGYLTGRLGADMMSHSDPANNSTGKVGDAAKARASGKTVRRIPVSIYASLTADGLFAAMYDGDGNCVTSAAGAEKAERVPMSPERLGEQFSKLGETPYAAADVSADAGDGMTVPVRVINEMRRELCEKLSDIRSKRQRAQLRDIPLRKRAGGGEKDMYLTAEVMTAAQAAAVMESGGVRRIYAPPKAAASIKSTADIEVVTKTADIFRPEDIGTAHVSVSSPAAIKYYGSAAAYGDHRLNIFNSETAAFYGGYLRCVTLSPELNLHEIRDITENLEGVETEIIGYGYLPLMIMHNCPVRAMGHCAKRGGNYALADREGKRFRIMCTEGCNAILLNSRPVFTADIIESIKKSGVNCIRLNFTVENPELCGKIVSVYRAALDGKDAAPMKENTFTRAHLRRGVL